MAKHCMRACGWCEYGDAESAGKDTCADEDLKCEDWRKKGECNANKPLLALLSVRPSLALTGSSLQHQKISHGRSHRKGLS